MKNWNICKFSIFSSFRSKTTFLWRIKQAQIVSKRVLICSYRHSRDICSVIKVSAFCQQFSFSRMKKYLKSQFWVIISSLAHLQVRKLIPYYSQLFLKAANVQIAFCTGATRASYYLHFFIQKIVLSQRWFFLITFWNQQWRSPSFYFNISHYVTTILTPFN